jgi:hypothetical protein
VQRQMQSLRLQMHLHAVWLLYIKNKYCTIYYSFITYLFTR